MNRRMIRPLAVVVAVVVAGAGVWVGVARPWRDTGTPERVEATDPAVAAAERERRSEGAQVREVTLTAAPATVDLGDRTVETWAFNGTVPGPEIRLRPGDLVRASVRNNLPDQLTIHWHGIALRNDMDGVPGMTQDPIAPGDEFVYEFTAPDPGTYFYHPHTGTQLDRGLYAPLIVEDPENPEVAVDYDRDFTVMVDDWIDGTGQTPDDVLAGLEANGGMGGMDMGDHGGMGGKERNDMGGAMGMGAMPTGGVSGGSDKLGAVRSEEQPLGEDTGDVDYPLYVINGRGPANPTELAVRPGERVRLRLVNAGSDTPFRVAVGGARLTVVATDGFPVEPVTVDTLLLGMGERYDVVVTVPGAGTYPLVAVAEGKDAEAVAVLRSAPGATPAPDARPEKLAGELLSLDDLRATGDVALPTGEPDRTYRAELTGGMMDYRWGISTDEEDGVTLPVRQGDRVRLEIDNQTMMWHPIHLHGQTFQVVTGAGTGPRKDTVIVPAMGTVTVELVADNPGQWALHCHNAYHAEAGMMTALSYVQ